MALAISGELGSFSASSLADTPASWLSETSGNWTTGSLWSTNPTYPNNGTPASTNYDAYISATGGTPYSVTLNSNITVNSLTLNSADATLNQTGGTLQAGSINLDAGIYELNGGTITGGTLNAGSNNFAVQNGTLNGVSITGGDLKVSGALNIQNGITIANNNLDMSITSSVYFDGPSQTVDNLNITPSGYVSIFASGPSSSGPETLTLGSNVTVHDGVRFLDDHSGDGLINDGTITADKASGYAIAISIDNFTNNGTVEATTGDFVNVNSSAFTNNGTAEATAGGSLNISSTNFTNNGTIEAAAGSTVTISSTSFVENGTLSAQGGSVQVTGGLTVLNDTVNLTNGSLQLGANGSLTLTGTSAVIESGSSTATVGGNLVLAPASGDQDNYTLSTGSTLDCQQSAVIGGNGSGTFTQTGGSGTVSSTLSVGNSGNLGAGSGTGVFNLSGGTFFAGTVLLGSSVGGSGALTVSGTGDLSIGGGAHLNDMTVNGGTVTVLDQTPPATEDTELNYALVGGYLTNGALNVNGGSVTSPFLKLGITKKFTGTFDQTGGSATFTILSAGCDGTLTSGQGNGIVNISGGTVSIDTLLLGSTQGGSGDMTVGSMSNGGGSAFIAGGAHLNDLNVDPGGSVTVSSTALPNNTPHDDEDPELKEALVAGYLTNGALNVNGGR